MLQGFRPIYNKVLVKRVETEKTDSGLHIPQAAREKKQHATVVSVGRGAYNKDGNLIPTSVQPGDVVWIARFQAQPIDECHFVVKEEDILGYMRD